MRASAVAGLLLATALLAFGCGDGDEPPPAEATNAAVEIAEFEFAPGEIAVAPGTEISWSNADKAPHTATAEDGSFDTDTLKRGDSAAISFDEPGSYPYYCAFHAFMRGTVEVE